MLYMRSVSDPDPDATARARIRDAAVECFARAGFDASMRTIAAVAGVSAALIVHHFGTKQGLREVCDEHVLQQIRDVERAGLTSGGPAALIAEMANAQRYTTLTAYLLRSLREGGALAAAFVAKMVADAEEYLAAGVASGMLRDSRDPAARARYLVYLGLGVLLVHATVEGETEDPAALFRSAHYFIALPSLELYTEGLLADRSLLDAYLAEYGTERSR